MKKRRPSKYTKGIYIPVNEDKYVQPKDRHMNRYPYPVYRSSWERELYKRLDFSSKVVFWSTESVGIPYVSPKDGKVHRYYPDIFIKTVDGKIYIVEVKPSRFQKDPVNVAKWGEARLYAERIGAEFIVMTENEFKRFGIALDKS